jgi:putative membrane protein
MITNYANHAANERTYLAWLRTGLAIVAFGFIVQKLTAASGTPASSWSSIEGATAASLSVIGRNGGLVLSLVGIAILVLGGFRFVRTARDIDDPKPRPAGTRFELLLSGALALLAAILCAYLSIA